VASLVSSVGTTGVVMTDDVKQLRQLRPEDLAELADVFYQRQTADHLLADAGFSRKNLPDASTSGSRWADVNVTLGDGSVPGGRLRILELALDRYPANDVFKQGVAEARRAAQRLAATESGGAAAEPVGKPNSRDRLPRPATVAVLDAVGYSRNGVMVQLAIRDGLREIFNDALADAEISPAAVKVQDTGDGLIAVISSDVPKAVVAADLVEQLRRGLRGYNRGRKDAGSIRLRLSLHHGDVVEDGTGWAGDAVIVGTRLVDAPPIRAVFPANPSASLAVIMSSEFYGATTAQELLGLDPGSYREVEVVVPKFTGKAWLTVPGLTGWTLEIPADADGAATPGSAPAAADASGADELPEDAVQWDFLIAAADKDESWGAWIAHTLEKDQTYNVHIETWDIQAAENLISKLEEAMAVAKRTIVIVSTNLLSSPKAQAVWMEAWRKDPAGQGRSLVPVIVGDYQPTGFLASIKPIRLSGTSPDADERELREQLRRTVDGRYRPTTPPVYPGMAS